MPVDVQLSHKQQRPQFVGKGRMKARPAKRVIAPTVHEDEVEETGRQLQTILEEQAEREKLDRLDCKKGWSPYDPEPWLRYAGAALVLGISRGTLEVWLSTKRYEIPHYKIGRNVLFKRSELQEWLESRRRGGDARQ